MTTATLKKATEALGLTPDDVVTYERKGHKCIIEVDFKKRQQKEKKSAFQCILSMSEDVGIKDWSANHDHYLYGTPKQETEE